MTSSKGPSHVVVDGSNIATEGRSLPSLAQLNEAVMAFLEEHPDTSVTVVVDATFGHRIDKSEAREFEDGISNNELVAPPAGAVGRGDAFVLSIAQKAKAAILSNDSFQEFHGDYDWLFDEGRLIGGKPVPHVGWVFVDRLPVRGPVSRKATGAARGGSRRVSKSEGDKGRSGRKASAAAMEPMPVPTAPPPGRKKADESAAPARGSASASGRSSVPAAKMDDGGGRRDRAPKAGETVNELMPFLEFVEHHPVGTSVNGTVESYSSHGAYISIGENGVRGYVPLRLMARPAPTSARKAMKLGESVTLVVVSFAPVRRSIDCAVPDMADLAIAEVKAALAAEAAAEREAGSSAKKQAPAKRVTAPKRTVQDEAATTASADELQEETTAAQTPAKAPAKKSAATRSAAVTPAKKAPAKTVAAKKAPAKKTPSGQAPSASGRPTKAAAKKAPATEAAAKSAPAKKAPAKKAPAKKAPAKKAPAKKAPAKKVPAEQPPAKRAASSRTSAKGNAAKKAPAAKAPARNAAARKASTTDAAAPSDQDG